LWWGKNIIIIMNRVQVVGANDGGVAYSRASVIPWKKRIDEGFYKQRGGSWFDGIKQTRGRFHKQKGGSWFDGLSQGMFGIKQTRGKKKREPAVIHSAGRSYPTEKQRQNRKQKGGGWFDGLSQGMFGIKQTRGKRKRKPAVIHSAGRSYPQKGGRYGFKGFFENPFGVKEKLKRRSKKQKV
jgi:hypothetical protein